MRNAPDSEGMISHVGGPADDPRAGRPRLPQCTDVEPASPARSVGQGENVMSRMQKALGRALVTVFCLITVGAGADPPSTDKAGFCAAQSTAPGGPPSTLAQWADGARLFDGLGDFHRAVSTNSPEAQAYFDQGMRFLWAFNHDEATRSFAKAAELDPQCAMCYWGVSLTIGPNYNMRMLPAPRAAVAREALKQAEQHAAVTTPVERALIGRWRNGTRVRSRRPPKKEPRSPPMRRR